MLDALVAGERDPVVLAGLARGVLRNKTDDLRLALAGRFTTHHGQMIEFHLARLDHLDQMIGQVKGKIGHPGAPGTSRRAPVEPAGLLARSPRRSDC
jgi:transposase